MLLTFPPAPSKPFGFIPLSDPKKGLPDVLKGLDEKNTRTRTEGYRHNCLTGTTRSLTDAEKELINRPRVITDVAAENKARLLTIFARWKGTGDIAGVAQALLTHNRWYRFITGRDYYGWAGSLQDTSPEDNKKMLVNRTSDWEAFVTTRHMMCYEFVQFCAYIASDQPKQDLFRQPGPDGKPENLVTSPDEIDPNTGQPVVNERVPGGKIVWSFASQGPGSPASGPGTNTRPLSGKNPTVSFEKASRGQVVTGVSITENNSAGYYHTGVVVGPNQMISLGSEGLKLETIRADFLSLESSGFSRLFYTEIFAGNFDYSANPSAATSGGAR